MALVETHLRDWLPRQRWFAAKDRPIGHIAAVTDFGHAEIIAVDGDRYLLTDLAQPAVRAAWWAALDRSDPPPPSRLLAAEQSNSSVLYGHEWMLKIFRRLQAGENPDYEIPHALASFPQVPAVGGRVVYGDTTLAVLHQFVPNLADGWDYARHQPLTEAELHLLGQRTATLHDALAIAFGSQPCSEQDLDFWRKRTAGPHQSLAPALDDLLGTALTRIHGDYHLGQTLKTADDWMIIDFEGEPARPLAERRRRGSPLQDVAGMLRSFGYLAAVAQRPEWEPMAREAFLAGYSRIACPCALRFFEAEKAVYERAYERAHRPDWAWIPEQALQRLLS